MPSSVYVEASPKVQNTRELEMHYQQQNVSPTKQKFSTLKNFLKNKSSLTELRSKAERKERERDDILYFTKPETIEPLRETKSATRLSDKFRVPKKKRSLGSLLPLNQIPSRTFDIQLETFPPITPTSPPPNLVRTSSISTKSSKTSKQSPPKLSFNLDDSNFTHKRSTSVYTPEMPFSKDWATPTSIRGTYVHDWSNNMSPRSLTESIKAGRVETHSQKFQLLGSPQIAAFDSKLKTTFDFVSDSSAEEDNRVKFDMKLNINNLVEPSRPLPSPCTMKNLPMENEDVTFTESNMNTSTSSANSISSNDSDFSFIVNRAASIRFYKSQEQIQKEATVDFLKKEKQKVKDFLGTAEQMENELLEGFSSNSRRILDGFDEDINYVNYDEEDDTDALFNRDLFGMSLSKPETNLELSYEGENNFDENCGNFSKDADEFKRPATLELADDEYEFKPPSGLELSDDELESKPSYRSELSEKEYNFHSPTDLDFYEDEYDFKPPSGLELFDDDESENIDEPNKFSAQGHGVTTENDRSTINSWIHVFDTKSIKSGNDDIQTSCFHYNQLSPSLESIVETSEDSSCDELIPRNKQHLHTQSYTDVSSKQILKMLNSSDSGLSFKPFNSEIQIKHTPSAKSQRHRSLKFHQLSGDIEDDYYKTDTGESNQWKNNGLLDEVNRIPEDYDYRNGYHILDGNTSFTSNSKKGRLSTIIVRNSDDYVNQDYILPVKTDGKQHVWKNLVTGNGKNNTNLTTTERIQLENKTITLFNRNIAEIQEPSNVSTTSDVDYTELSTIME